MSASLGAQAEPAGKNTRRLIDISVAIHEEMPSWDKLEGVGPHRELVQRQDQGGVAFVSKVDLVVHTGTHFDAPSHFLQEAFESGRGMEAIQLHIMNGVCQSLNEQSQNVAKTQSAAGPALVLDIPHNTNITGLIS